MAQFAPAEHVWTDILVPADRNVNIVVPAGTAQLDSLLQADWYFFRFFDIKVANISQQCLLRLEQGFCSIDHARLSWFRLQFVDRTVLEGSHCGAGERVCTKGRCLVFNPTQNFVHSVGFDRSPS